MADQYADNYQKENTEELLNQVKVIFTFIGILFSSSWAEIFDLCQGASIPNNFFSPRQIKSY